ncbi:pentatricopeptide repeat-containing protein At5g16860-like [Apium graveolens]|uniref:pentatricopeptide repeat-containing protein At5g16860-like n=1 Tax=Apium graveolens TaxID=4045 RepID=UPI003D798F97
MRCLGFHADHFIFPFVLKSCTKLFRVGLFDFAEDLFRRMSNRNIVSWTAMISGYTQSGLANKALGLFDEMTDDRLMVKPNWVTIMCLLPACAHSATPERGKKIHSYASANGKRIIFLLEGDYPEYDGFHFRENLKKKYMHMKDTADEFEVTKCLK